MGVKYLSDEWAKAVTEAVNANDAFKQQAAGKAVKLQYVITTADGEVKYYTELKDGQADVSIGEIDDPEATLSSDYDTSAALFRNELNATAAYMSGKLKIQGDLMKLMQLQGIVNTIPEATKEIDVEF
ncbi:MAG: SCP2 sterol-binding domain-containing protein [Actinomycetota bacterium]